MTTTTYSIDELIENDDGEHPRLLKMMKSGPENVEAVQEWFNKQNINEINIHAGYFIFRTTKNLVLEKTMVFDNFRLVKPILSAVLPSVTSLLLDHPTLISFPFLGQLKSLKRLVIIASSVEIFKATLKSLKNLKSVDYLYVNVHLGDTSLLQLMKFKIMKRIEFSFELHY